MEIRLENHQKETSDLVRELKVKDETIMDLQNKSNNLLADCNSLSNRVKALEDQNRSLIDQTDSLANEREARGLEIKAITKDNEKRMEENEVLVMENKKLRDDIAQLRSQLLKSPSSARSAGTVRDDPQPSPLKYDAGNITPVASRPPSESGDILKTAEEDVKAYSAELLSLSKKDNKSAVLAPMKSILLSCKKIIEECEIKEDDPKIHDDDLDSLQDAKAKLSDSLTTLMQTTKQHASAGNSKTMKTIEAELSHLSFCVSDLLDLLQIIEGNAGGFQSSKADNGPGKFDSLARTTKRDTARASIFQQPEELPPLDMDELRDYLGEQTDIIAHTIQDLLQAMRNPKGDDILDLVNSIATCIDNIIYETQGTMDTSPDVGKDLLDDSDDIMNILSDLRLELLDLGDDFVRAPNDRAIKQKVANSSYDVAKQAKDLLSILDY